MKRLLTLLCCLAALSCSKNKYLDPAIDTPTVEFSKVAVEETISFRASDVYDIAVPIQVFGGESDATVTVTAKTTLPADCYSVEEEKTLAGSPLDSIHIKINTARLKKGTAYTITLTLSSAQIAVAKNYATCVVTFSQQAFIDFFTGRYSCHESSTGATYDVEFTKMDATTAKNMNFWDFPLAGQYVPFIFGQDDSFSVSIPEDSEWTDFLGNKYLVTGAGTYDLQGNFAIDFVMKDAKTNAEYQKGIQTYTRKR